MEINLNFKSLTLINGEAVKLNIASSSMQKMVMDLVANGYLSTEELIILAIGQIKLCDRKHFERVLPENVLNKLNETVESVKNGKADD